MNGFLAVLRTVGAGGLVYVEPVGAPVDPGYGRPSLPDFPPVDPGYGRPGFPDRPGNALPMPPVKPSTPIVLPPGVWPPRLPPGVDNTLPPVPPGHVAPPIYLPVDPDLGIEHPIVIPPLPHDVALLIALPAAQPKAGTPPNTVPAILVQSGKKPVLVYVSAAATPR